MKFAYADPPYYGHGKRLYGQFHDEAAVWDTKEAHLQLVVDLTASYPDGWALSCNPVDLQWLLPGCPDTVRVCAWTKTFHQIRPKVSVQYSWEPVIVYGGRKVPNRNPMVRDYLSAAVAMRRGLVGSKPPAFNVWVLDLLGFDPAQDTMTDLFPGTCGMEQVLSTYEAVPCR